MQDEKGILRLVPELAEVNITLTLELDVSTLPDFMLSKKDWLQLRLRSLSKEEIVELLLAEETYSVNCDKVEVV